MNKNEITRCSWAKKEIFHAYHDNEWGIPVHSDKTHFEFLILEGAQAGLSWETILKRRSAYRDAFKNFDPQLVSQMTDLEAQALMTTSNIIRNRLKIAAAINNAKFFIAIQKEFGSFDSYIWSFVDHKTILYSPKTIADFHVTNFASDAASKDLKKRGLKFVGSTIIYAHMQACGLVSEHETTCFKAILCNY